MIGQTRPTMVRDATNLMVNLCLAAKARLARVRACGKLPHVALQVADFSFRLGVKLLLGRHGGSLRYLVAPVEGTRYLEFPFVLQHATPECRECLDVSSPRMLSLFWAQKHPRCEITIINPDSRDLTETQRVAGLLGLSSICIKDAGCEILPTWKERFDCIWSVSVVEHVEGAYDDCQAVRWMYNALKPGGRLILTVPTDKVFWIEYRNNNLYGTQLPTRGGLYFFQRFYDDEAIRDRLIKSIGVEPESIAWFGENKNGLFHAYIRRLISHGLSAHASDPLEIAANYREFPSWNEMPGAGVCCLAFRKPLTPVDKTAQPVPS